MNIVHDGGALYDRFVFESRKKAKSMEEKNEI